PVPMGTGLRRPTSLAELPDGSLLVTEYGKWTGRLGPWYQKENEWQMKTLADRPGALGVVLDTTAVRPTAYVLFGQGREEIVEYVRQTDGNWQSRVLLSFPPSYGSSSLQLTDWNGDGQPDLLYTNGDNADYVSSVKAYHGIRVFVREDASFSEALFLPLPGAYGARVADFDADGDLDVAAISFFPDYRQTKPGGIVLYAQDPAGTFTAHPLADADRGRWLTLHSGDLDGDGDLDLVAGNLALEPVPDGGRLARWIKEGLPFLVWKNQLYQ
ncbi:MAG: VCBS repeat-containing protein, partial [Bacteroidota bacterium]